MQIYAYLNIRIFEYANILILTAALCAKVQNQCAKSIALRPLYSAKPKKSSLFLRKG